MDPLPFGYVLDSKVTFYKPRNNILKPSLKFEFGQIRLFNLTSVSILVSGFGFGFGFELSEHSRLGGPTCSFLYGGFLLFYMNTY